jgi:putative ABC transport system ATP-binding protein
MSAFCGQPDQSAAECFGGLSISLRGLVKILPDGRHVLDSIDLELKAGDTAALCGPSGSGKTSLAHVIAGIDHDYQGIVSLSGFSFQESENFPQPGRVAMIFQDGGLFDNLTALQNVAMAALFRYSTAEAFRKSSDLLSELGIGHIASVRARGLSAGEKQRVAVARALISEPILIIADEPTACLDSATAGLVGDLLVESAVSMTSTLLVITHDPILASKCNRRFIMRDGKITESMAGHEVGKPEIDGFL